MIDRELLFEKLDKCEENSEREAQHWNKYYEDSEEDFYYQGYAHGIKRMCTIVRRLLNDNN